MKSANISFKLLHIIAKLTHFSTYGAYVGKGGLLDIEGGEIIERGT